MLFKVGSPGDLVDKGRWRLRLRLPNELPGVAHAAGSRTAQRSKVVASLSAAAYRLGGYLFKMQVPGCTPSGGLIPWVWGRTQEPGGKTCWLWDAGLEKDE